MSARLQNSAFRCAGLAQSLSTSSARAVSPRLYAAPIAQAPSRWQRRSAWTPASSPKAPATTPMRPVGSDPSVSPAVANSEVKASKSAQAQAQSASRADLTQGLSDEPLPTADASASTGGNTGVPVDWTRSYQGLSAEPFSETAAEILLAPLDPEEVEVKPDGILYLPEIKYRRILNKAFRPGGWGLAPRGETIVTARAVTREYGLVVLGRLVSVARGEQDYFSPEGIPTAAEGCRSNALVRCCKDLGIGSELWDPRFIRDFNATHVKEVWAEHVSTKKRKKLFTRKNDPIKYPWKEVKV